MEHCCLENTLKLRKFDTTDKMPVKKKQWKMKHFRKRNLDSFGVAEGSALLLETISSLPAKQ